MSERTGFSAWSSIVATWVSVLGALGGGFIGLTTYGEEVAKMEDGRVVQTFALFEMFNSAERLQSRGRIFDHMANGAELNRNDLYVMLDFYDALHICVERNLCDRDLAVRLFQSYAIPLWDQFATTIGSNRTDSDPRFGAGLQWMASLPMQSAESADTVETTAEAAPAENPTSNQAGPAETAGAAEQIQIE